MSHDAPNLYSMNNVKCVKPIFNPSMEANECRILLNIFCRSSVQL